VYPHSVRASDCSSPAVLSSARDAARTRSAWALRHPPGARLLLIPVYQWLSARRHHWSKTLGLSAVIFVQECHGLAFFRLSVWALGWLQSTYKMARYPMENTTSLRACNPASKRIQLSWLGQRSKKIREPRPEILKSTVEGLGNLIRPTLPHFAPINFWYFTPAPVLLY
jgi:hypothetical protein